MNRDGTGEGLGKAKVFWEPGGGITMDGVHWATQKQCRLDLGLSERQLKRVKESGILPVASRPAFRKLKEEARKEARGKAAAERRQKRRDRCPADLATSSLLAAVRAMAWKARDALHAYQLDPEACADEVEDARNATEHARRVGNVADTVMARLMLEREPILNVINAIGQVETTLYRASCECGMQGDADSVPMSQSPGHDEGWPPGMELHFRLVTVLPQVLLAESLAVYAGNMAAINVMFRDFRRSEASDLLEDMITGMLPDGEDEWAEAVTGTALLWTRRGADDPADEVKD